MKKLVLTEIWIYPIKSLGGIRLNHARVFEKGLEFDRRWMLVDENDNFMTQRKFPEMSLFKLAINGDKFFVSYYDPRSATINNPSIIIEASSPALGKAFKAIVWDDVVDVIEADKGISEWFSDHLHMNCRFVNFPDTSQRFVDNKYQVNNENVSLADGYPFLIIGQNSLDDLNKRLTSPVPINRFRPNFVFSGGDPYEEDSWKNFTIGVNHFTVVKPCARCVLTTVDQETGEKGTEPLLTLSTYRRRDNKVFFGQNLVSLDHHFVSVGDAIIIG